MRLGDEREEMSKSQIRLKLPRVIYSFAINSNKLFPLNCLFFNVRCRELILKLNLVLLVSEVY
jgi:hypothetical protein